MDVLSSVVRGIGHIARLIQRIPSDLGLETKRFQVRNPHFDTMRV
jgi:hypothetical protein